MKKLLYTLLAVSLIFSACKKEDDEVIVPTVVYGCTDSTATNYNSVATQDDGSCTYTPTSTVYDTLVGYWNLTQYDIGNGLTVADTGQYINFIDETDLMVNLQITGYTWVGDFSYEATSDSIKTMNQDLGITNLQSQNMILSTEVGFFGTTIYHLHFEK